MKRNYTRIAHKLYREPWLIMPSIHQNMRSIFEAHIANADLPIADSNETQAVPTVPRVAVVPMFGIIGKHLSNLEMQCGGASIDEFATALKTAANDPNTDAIVLWFNSPGGSVTGIPETAQLIADTDKIKPVYAFADCLCASAAYWLASQARAFIVTPSSNIGSVGCYIYLEDHSQELAIAGIKPEAIVSESSPLKLAGASFKPLTSDERAMFQAQVNEIYLQFTKSYCEQARR
jgi:ClpP class serine protease